MSHRSTEDKAAAGFIHHMTILSTEMLLDGGLTEMVRVWVCRHVCMCL